MGNQSSHAQLNQAVQRAESRRGRIQVAGRYHRRTKNLEDDYILEEIVLGTGSNGEVVLATNRHTGTQVAVKTLQLHGLSDSKKKELINEVEVYLCMDHPHVARLFEVYESESTLSLVMEYMEGGELFERATGTNRKNLSEADVVSATWQMLLALNYLHSEGVVHRDLKLENFLYEKKQGSYLKLIDFGFSKICGKGKHLGCSCGTLSYVAPEVLDMSYTSQCDLWSLGVIVFILLCGKMPFYGKGDLEIMQSIRKGECNMNTKNWSRVSEKAKDFVRRLLDTDPERRLTAPEALEHAWLSAGRPQARSEWRMDSVDSRISESLLQFAKQPRFRRGCSQLMAWSLSVEERSQVRNAFLELDQHHTGMVKLKELKQVLEDKFDFPTSVASSVIDAFRELDGDQTQVIRYSDFLAAMLSTRLALREDLVRETVRRFDTQNCGHLSPEALKRVLGKKFDVDKIFEVLDANRDGKISVDELVYFLLNEGGQEFGRQVSCSSGEMTRVTTSMSDWSTDVSANGLDGSAIGSADSNEPAGDVSRGSRLGLRKKLQGLSQRGCLRTNRIGLPSFHTVASGGA